MLKRHKITPWGDYHRVLGLLWLKCGLSPAQIDVKMNARESTVQSWKTMTDLTKHVELLFSKHGSEGKKNPDLLVRFVHDYFIARNDLKIICQEEQLVPYNVPKALRDAKIDHKIIISVPLFDDTGYEYASSEHPWAHILLPDEED